jgi:hypothetical protein
MLAVITVDSLLDNFNPDAPATDGMITLREAVLAANNDSVVGDSPAGSGADTIQFHSSLSGNVDLSFIGDSVAGPSGLLVTTPITLRGNSNGITIARNAAVGEMRLFRVAAGGDLTLESIMLTGGLARGEAGTLIQPNGSDGRGGAVLNEGTLQIVASTLYGNQVHGGAAADGGTHGIGRGGAVYSDGGTMVVRNTTLSGNAAYNGNVTGSAWGGTIYVLNGTITINHGTITNSTATAGRGVYVFADGINNTASAVIDHTIIGQADFEPGVSELIVSSDNGGSVSSSGTYNLVRKELGFEGSVVSTADPQVGPLEYNGGPTRTHALLPGSPAIDAGDPAAVGGVGSVPWFDQRGSGFARVEDGNGVDGSCIDLGALEVQSEMPLLPGDYNDNEVVDAADYTVWRDHFGLSVPRYSGADGDGSTMIDAGDYNVWKLHFGEMTLPASAGTQEAADRVPVEPLPERVVAASAIQLTERADGPFVSGTSSAVEGISQESRFLAVNQLELAILENLAERGGENQVGSNAVEDEASRFDIAPANREHFRQAWFDEFWADWLPEFDLF